MSFFFPREVGSIETGPQIFAGTVVPNTTFYFNKTIIPAQPIDPPGLFNSVQVQNGGLYSLNGTFDYVTESDGKPYYNKDSNGNLFIIWYLNSWGIYNFTLSSNPIYFSSEDVLYPWNVITWQVQAGYGQTPIVTKII
jgi:hypothetical protein